MTAATKEDTFAGSRSMRENYAQGVDAYYQDTGGQYRNPHFPGIVSAVALALDRWSQYHLPAMHPEVDDAVWAAQLPHAGKAAALIPPINTTAHTSCNQQVDPQSSAADNDEVRQDDCASALPTGCQGQPVTDASSSKEEQEVQQAPSMTLPSLPPACKDSDGGYAAGRCVRVLDLACGSGEASQAITMWWQAATTGGCGGAEVHMHSQANTITQGSDTDTNADNTHSPSQSASSHPQYNDSALQSSSLLHAHAQPVETAGSHASNSSNGPGLQLALDATDPYTGQSFLAWTGREADTFSFQDIGSGYLMDEGRSYHVCVCSYAMHVLDASYLYSTLQQLALVCEALLIISPHKLPKVDSCTGWRLVENLVSERVHARLYLSDTLMCSDDLHLNILEQ